MFMKTIRVILTGGFRPLSGAIKALKDTEGISLLHVFTEEGKASGAETICRENEIPFSELSWLYQPEGISRLKELQPDWLFNLHATRILPEQVLAVPRKGALNLHFGKLPEYAGLFTHQWAILNGEQSITVTLHWMEKGIDTGPIALEKEVPLASDSTGLSVLNDCIQASESLLQETIRLLLAEKELPSYPQDLSRRKLYQWKDLPDGHIDWHRSCEEILRFLRAADHGVFESPSYQPYSLLGNQKIRVRKGEAAPLSGRKTSPGTVMVTEEKGIVIATGDHPIRILLLQDEKGTKLRGEDIPTTLGLREGNRLH